METDKVMDKDMDTDMDMGMATELDTDIWHVLDSSFSNPILKVLISGSVEYRPERLFNWIRVLLL